MDKTRILIIDDDAGLQKILDLQLGLSGFETLHALKPEDGLRLIGEQEISLILLDVSMPSMDGFQLFNRIRSNPVGSEVPVIFLSSFDRQYLKIKGLELGADDYITKPFDSAELIARIKAVLRRYGGAAKSRRGASHHQGDVKAVGLAELLQLIAQSRKPCTVLFSEMNGAIVANNGELLSAVQGGHSGIEALIRLFLLERGGFEIEYEEIPASAPSRGQSIESLLLGVITRTDECLDQLKALGGGKARVRAGLGLGAGFEALRGKSSLSLLQLLVLLPGTIDNNLVILAKELAAGRLAPANG